MNNIIFKEVQKGNDKMGLMIKENEFEIMIPKYYLNSNELTELNNQTKRKLRKLFKAWNKYQERKNGLLGSKFNKENNIYNLNNALKLIQDYIEYGLYIEQEKAVKITNNGKMNFKRTINTCKPLYTKQGPIYLNYITDIKKNNDEDIIRTIQATIINDISSKIGWIMGFNFNIPITNKISLNNKVLMQLKERLNQSFNTRKINLIKMLIEYIESSNAGLEDGKELFIGMANLFWQDMINHVIGNVKKAELEKYFYVRHAYYKGENEYTKLSALMPDSVFKNNNNIIIIDSKYYINNSLPNNEDINKQYIYMIKALNILPDYNNYRNCFILPTDAESYKSENKIVFDISLPNMENALEINLIYANLNEILDLYINDKKDNNIIKDLIVSN